MLEGWTLHRGGGKSRLASMCAAGLNRVMDLIGSSSVLIQIADLDGTRNFARALAARLEPGDTLILEGPLGAGKTSLSREILYALGVEEGEVITSPTFGLVHEYEGRGPLIHADLYRLEHTEELEELGLDELSEEGAIALIEWGSRFEEELRGVIAVLELNFAVKGESERRVVRIQPRSARGVEMAEALGGVE